MGCFLGPCLLGVCVGMLLMSFALNFGGTNFDVKSRRHGAHPADSTERRGIATKSRAEQNPSSFQESCGLADVYLNVAAEIDAAGDDGHWGWLYLLAAHDLCPTDTHILSNLINNYEAAGYIDIALDELTTLKTALELVAKRNQDAASVLGRLGVTMPESGIDRTFHSATRMQLAHIEDVMKGLQHRKHNDAHAQLFAVLNDDDDYTTRDPAKAAEVFHQQSAQLPEPLIQLPFSTAVGEWDFSNTYKKLDVLHSDLYSATISGYKLMLQELESQGGNVHSLSDTELNHRFFNWQMRHLHSDGEYWSGFGKDSLWMKLMHSSRVAAAQLLQVYGFSATEAWQKASHRTVLWASVHTGAYRFLARSQHPASA